MVQIPPLFVVTGPSGVGKGTVVREVLAQHPEIWFSVSATTREPRPGEVHGTHYFFVTHAEFEQMIEDGELLEWAHVFGMNYYGTPRRPVAAHLKAGRPVLLELDLDGARQVRVSAPEAFQVFLAPPSFDELRRRLVGRGTETEASLERRLETARTEMAASSEFDAVVVNDDVTKAAQELARLMGLSPG